MRNFLLAAAVLLIAFPSVAVEPSEVLDDPILETRARKISQGLRCLVCQNQSIDDSAAVLARDLRVLVRERLVAGDGDQEVIDYVVSRYGEFVLLKPRFAWHTIVLWAAGPVALIAGLILGGLFVWTGNLIAPITAHIMVNAVSLPLLARRFESENSCCVINCIAFSCFHAITTSKSLHEVLMGRSKTLSIFTALALLGACDSGSTPGEDSSFTAEAETGAGSI